MKTIHGLMQTARQTRVGVVAVCGILLLACQDPIDKSAIYTFTGQTVTDVLKEDPDLSDYYELTQIVTPTEVSESPVAQLVSARGHYTCFAPTNEAMREYLDELLTKGVITQKVNKAYEIEDENVRDSIMKVIVLNSIIDCGDDNEAYTTFDFQNDAALPLANMNDRLLRTNITSENGQTLYLVSRTCPVIQRDIEAVNGYVQKMGKVVAPSNSNLNDLMQNVDNMTFFNELLQRTGLNKRLTEYRDYVYEEAYLRNVIPHTYGTIQAVYKDEALTPEHRDIGFTIFAETDDVYRSNQISSIEDLIKWLVANNYYVESQYDQRTAAEGGDYTDPNHILYQFTAYHILPQSTPYDRLVIHNNEFGFNYKSPAALSVPVYEYCITLNENPRRLVKITESKYSEGIRLNRYTDMLATVEEYDEIVNENTIPGIKIEPYNGERDNEAINGYVYPIGEILVYDEELMRGKVLNERLRFDVGALLPELMTNKLRGIWGNLPRSIHRAFPHNYSYFGDNFDWSEKSMIVQFQPGWRHGFAHYQADAFKMVGRYDFTLKLPPIPADGTYELRFMHTPNLYRGLAQLYFGEEGKIKPLGIPYDLRVVGTDATIGWEADVEDDEEYNRLVDKRMRNNGHMKAPKYIAYNNNPYSTTRGVSTALRRVFFRRHMERDKTYFVRFKSMLENEETQFHLDCIELVPSNIYNNPEKLEDLW